MNPATNPAPRLLPWPSPGGNPCYLVTDNGGGYLSRLADDLEAAQLAIGADVSGSPERCWTTPPRRIPRSATRGCGLPSA
jgi:hypothetical protein